jgi:ABC-type uncharacterized transport system ATPase subunit
MPRQRVEWYYDTFSGLLPVKVVKITGVSGVASTAQQVTAEVLADLDEYHKGEQIVFSGLRLIPRQAVKRTKLGTYVRPYELTVTAQGRGQ